jgi:MoaA/NifB/PqqE/SkfB family radical SAM enzyme
MKVVNVLSVWRALYEKHQKTVTKRQLLLFWQFNGDNRSFCNYHCPYCYGERYKNYRHYWNGKLDKWQQAFERLNRDIYFVFSYGEAMGSHGFYDCVNMIGEHPTWTLNIVTNLSYPPERLIASRLGQEKRVFIIASWHPLGCEDREKGWKNFQKHLLALKEAEIPVQVMYLWYKPQIEWFPEYFEWLDKNDFRVNIRRHLHQKRPLISKLFRRFLPKYFSGKFELEDYSPEEEACLYTFNCPKVAKYNLDLASTYGRPCSAGKDMILVEHDGTVKPCADCCGPNHKLGNIFDPKFRLNKDYIRCPTNTCGGHYGMLHLIDNEFGELPERLWNDNFVSQVENLPQTSPVAYARREERLECLEAIKNGR